MHPLDYGNAVDFDSSLAYLDDHSLEDGGPQGLGDCSIRS